MRGWPHTAMWKHSGLHLTLSWEAKRSKTPNDAFNTRKPLGSNSATQQQKLLLQPNIPFIERHLASVRCSGRQGHPAAVGIGRSDRISKLVLRSYSTYQKLKGRWRLHHQKTVTLVLIHLYQLQELPTLDHSWWFLSVFRRCCTPRVKVSVL